MNEQVMGLPFYLPSYVKDAEKSWERSIEIECFNFSTECLGRMLVDGKYWLEGSEASSSFYVIPNGKNVPIDYSIASFYADCIGFEHEIAALAVPNDKSYLKDIDIPWGCRHKVIEERDFVENFIRYFREASAMSTELLLGANSPINFKYDFLFGDEKSDLSDDIVEIKFIPNFWDLRIALHLYCAAFRQSDPMMAYLCFYRVIENCCEDNGKVWIESMLETKLLSSKYNVWSGVPPQQVMSESISKYVRKKRLVKAKGNQVHTNLLELTRAIAVRRLLQLKKRKLSRKDIAKRLYKDNRCGIAHGKSNIRSHDLASDFREVLVDIPLIRFLARLAIEEKIKP